MKKVTVKKSKVQSPIRVNNNVFIRTVTYHYTGKIEIVSKDTLVLSNAAWIADSGRFATAMNSGVLNEVEPYPENTVVAIERGAIVDISDWKFELPRIQK